MRAKSLRTISFRTVLALVVVAGSMTLFNMPRASATVLSQALCAVSAEQTYADAKGGSRAAAYSALQYELARCRRLTDTKN
ncbi:hypothetical protein JQ621_19240 [Bradyrhizobium manausense]|uniref:hypothetical protein n=1 Tax=Bradyrhizobium manausense TaxID=989370 RepID=UPI001BAD6091|nr:hypothetical protein [Bradyrhizobium manausense]MBR1089603.1 hypothetical protein [Bradyrhizobium manausense]